MTVICVLIVWALNGQSADLSQPWSAWFTALCIAAVIDL